MVFVDLIVILLLVFVSGIRDTIKAYQKMTLFLLTITFRLTVSLEERSQAFSGFIPFNLVVFF